jgi:hypothetical protein
MQSSIQSINKKVQYNLAQGYQTILIMSNAVTMLSPPLFPYFLCPYTESRIVAHHINLDL